MPLRKELKKVLVLGSGPIVIGQAAEFDYAGTQACLALREEGIEVILLNNNPATIMTDQSIADKVYIEPLTVETVEEIIKKEHPDGIIGTLGGQTGLNLSVELYENGILDKYQVELLGTSVTSIQNGEDRDKFRNLMLKIGEPIPESKIIESFEDGITFIEKIGYPVIIRPAYTLGGAGGGFANNREELEALLLRGLSLSPIHQVLMERSIKGWKEIEYEVMRDANDTCVIVCNMENMDPVGVHTGDSIVVAPSQTLSDIQYQILRDASLKVIRALKIIGGCNIQFALDPNSNHYYIIEVNPRVSRSSALASKATGYPIARIAAKCAIGYQLDEIINPITGNTFASFEPALDYLVVKIPRFPFDKFPEADRTLGTQMKATGEVMAIDRSFEGALNKALRSLELNVHGLYLPFVCKKSNSEIIKLLETPNDLRLFAIAGAFKRNIPLAKLIKLTHIDKWFLTKIKAMVDIENKIADFTWGNFPKELLMQAKLQNISDFRIAEILGTDEKKVRERRKELMLLPGYKLVDTCAAEFDAVTPYYYSTWQGSDEVEVTNNPNKVLVIGSGPIRIGQGIEFDYCSVHAALALKKKGYETIVINNNPETVSTDYSIADKLYFEPITVEDVLHVIQKEQIHGVLIQFGGQTAINIANALAEEGVNILGTSTNVIDQLEDRKQFYQLLKRLNIPHIPGETVTNPFELKGAAHMLGFPVLIRPSYVIGGQSMSICHNDSELDRYLKLFEANANDRMWPLLVDKYLPGLECELDVISDGNEIIVPGIFEHLERAGVHSGDSIAFFPPVSLSDSIKELLVSYANKIAKALPVVGMMNIQFVIFEEVVYVLEVNPRASRTVPILSKVTGIPMIEWATNIQLGETAVECSAELGLMEEPNYYSVKAPIFSANKLYGVDHILGPEMKSTGEVLGLGKTLKEALSKVTSALPDPEKKPYIICSVADSAKKDGLPIIKLLSEHEYKIIASEGTEEFLLNNGIPVEKNGKSAFDRLFKEDCVACVLNIPTQGRNNSRAGFNLRELAVKYQVPLYTSLETIKPIINFNLNDNVKARTLSEYYLKEGMEVC